MNKTLLLSAVLLCCAPIFGQKIVEGSAAHRIIPGATLIRYSSSNTPNYIRLSESARFNQSDAESWIKATLGLSESESLTPKRTEKDQLGFEHIVYQHFYNGIPVEYSEFRVHSQAQQVVSLNGELYRGLQIDVQPSITSSAAIENAKAYIGATSWRWENPAEEQHLKLRTKDSLATFAPQPELVIVPFQGNYDGNDFRLCYKMDIYASFPLSRNWVYVDAHTGEIVWKTERIHETDTPGTAQTMYSGTQTITTDSFGGGFRLQESGRGNGIATYDMNEGLDYSDAVDFTDTDNNWGATTPAFDQYALDAHFGAEKTYDYYMDVHGRNSLDDNGFALLSFVHYDQDFGNAFWDGAEMTYGDGDGATFNEPLTTLDIAGHEITHGLTEHTANLVYQDESGALNESFSDIFGVTIDNYGSGVTGTSMWRIGEQCTSNGNGIRLMSNPSSFGDPDTYEGTNWIAAGGADNGGVHSNSGVQNFWYYLMCTGGTGTNDNGDTYNVSGIPMADAAAIAFRNLTVYLGPNSEYADARFYSIQAAIDLYGACSPEVITTTNAWYAVGVGNVFDPVTSADFATPATSICSAPATVMFQNLSNNGITFNWYFGDGTTSNDETPSHTYTENGTYTVSLAIDGGDCGSDSTSMTNYITIELPDAPTADDASGCGTTMATLEADATGTAFWYDSPGATAPIFEGNSFTTPPLTATTTYYVEDRILNGSGEVGPATNSFGSGGNHNNTSTQYLEFTVHQTTTIETVNVYAGSAGARTLQIWDADGNELHQLPFTVSSGLHTVDVNITLYPGDYRIGGTQMSLYRNNAGASFPYTLAGLIDITGTSAGDDYYYYFYDWSVSSSCISERTPVTVNVDPVIADFDFTANGTQVTFNNTSTNGVTYEWFFGDGNNSQQENPNYDFGDFGTYQVTLITDNGNCTDTIIQTVLLSDVGLTDWNSSRLNVAPNPFTGTFTLQFSNVASGTNVDVVLKNALGQQVADVYHGVSDNVSNGLQWNGGTQLAQGIYLLDVRMNNKQYVYRLVKQ